MLDEDTLFSPDIFEHSSAEPAPGGQPVSSVDPNLFNLTWAPDVPIGESGLGITTLPEGQEAVKYPFGDIVGFGNMEDSNMQQAPLGTLPVTHEEVPINPGDSAEAPQNEAWIHSLSQINVELYLQYTALERCLGGSVGSSSGGSSRKSSSGALVEAAGQFCISQTFVLMHRLLQALNEVSSSARARLDSGSVLLVFSCYHRLLEIYAGFFRHPDVLGQPSPELSAHLRRSPFLMGHFELDTASPLYTPVVISLAEVMLSKCRDAVNNVNGGTAMTSGIPEPHYQENSNGGTNAEQGRKDRRDLWSVFDTKRDLFRQHSATPSKESVHELLVGYPRVSPEDR